MTKSNKNKSKNNKRKSNKNNNNSQPKTRTVYVERPVPSIGAQLGDKLQKLGESVFSRFFGSGDYTTSENITDISKNALMGSSMRPPTFASAGKGQFVFEHTEYCFDLVTGAANTFNVNKYTINPSIPDLFPWLSSMAENFEYYQIEGLLFRYVSTSGDSITSTNTALGNVMMYVNPDIYDPVVLTKQALLQYEGCVDAKPSQNILIGAECDPDRMITQKFYLGNPPTGTDRRFNDFGQLVVATNGFQAANVTCGEIWASYRIRFFTAKTPDSDVGGTPDGLRYSGYNASSALPFGTQSYLLSTLQNAKVSASTVQFDCDDQQLYFVFMNWVGTSVTGVSPSITITNAVIQGWFNQGTYTDFPTWGFTSIRQDTCFVVKASSNGVLKIALSGGTLPPTANVDINIMRVSTSLQ